MRESCTCTMSAIRVSTMVKNTKYIEDCFGSFDIIGRKVADGVMLKLI